MNTKFTVVIQQEENWYVATCLENSVANFTVSAKRCGLNVPSPFGRGLG